MTNLSFGGLLFSIAISVALIPVWVIARAIYNHFFPPKSDDPNDYLGNSESHYWPPVYPRDHPLYRDPDDDDDESET